MKQKRVAKIERITNETKIKLELDLDGSGKTEIKTGIRFFGSHAKFVGFSRFV